MRERVGGRGGVRDSETKTAREQLRLTVARVNGNLGSSITGIFLSRLLRLCSIDQTYGEVAFLVLIRTISLAASDFWGFVT